MDFSMQDIKFLPGVGPQKATLFASELGIRSVEDLLHHFPYKYVDRSRFYYLHEITENMPFIQVKGQILKFEKIGEGKNMRLSAVFTDGKDTIELVQKLFPDGNAGMGVNATRLVVRAMELRILDIDNLRPDDD